MFYLYTPLKCRKASNFLTFSGGIKMEYWGKMGSVVSFVKLPLVSYCKREFFKASLTKSIREIHHRKLTAVDLIRLL